MSERLNEAAAILNDQLSGSFSGTAKFHIQGEGAILVTGSGAEVVEESTPADVTLIADADTFQGILAGTENPTTAFMSGKLKVEGDMGMAMQLASAL